MRAPWRSSECSAAWSTASTAERVVLYRICRAAHRALDGEGARLYGGRWNRPGRAMVYTSTSLSLAALEYLIHVDPEDAPDDLIALAIALADDAEVVRADVSALPAGWEQVRDHPACKALGDEWLRGGREVALLVPSAPIPEELNVLLNPRHIGASTIRVTAERPFFFDLRLLR